MRHAGKGKGQLECGVVVVAGNPDKAPVGERTKRHHDRACAGIVATAPLSRKAKAANQGLPPWHGKAVKGIVGIERGGRKVSQDSGKHFLVKRG
jgi:hypothetical protein